MYIYTTQLGIFCISRKVTKFLSFSLDLALHVGIRAAGTFYALKGSPR